MMKNDRRRPNGRPKTGATVRDPTATLAAGRDVLPYWKQAPNTLIGYRGLQRAACTPRETDRMAIMDWRMTKRGYYIHPRLPGERAGIVSEQDKTGLWRFAVRERATGAVVRVGDSYPTAAAAMDAAEAVGAPGQPNKNLAGQVMDFLQDKQGSAGQDGRRGAEIPAQAAPGTPAGKGVALRRERRGEVSNLS